VSALAFSPDGLKLAAGDVSTHSNLIGICLWLTSSTTTSPKKNPFRLVTPCVGADPILTDSHTTFFLIEQSSGKVILYDVAKREVITSRWSFHSARVNALSWTADSLHCASGALDTHIYVWSVQKPIKNIAIKNAVPGGVNAVLWLSDRDSESKEGSRLAGSGVDAAIKVWQVRFHA
jgi:WD40 repeat protein